MADAAEWAREYYRALDEHDYDALAEVLAPEFVQERPDMTLEGRERFVRFMREERPQTDTSHVVEAIFVRTGDADVDDGHCSEITEVAVRGRLLRANGDLITRYVDVFTVGDDGFERLDTYTL